ncbi:hypothetical protein [Rehaibacterium terrae]|jgi:DUF4097 and DUF4098 domain-containing protein YvlB|uniref:DUF4097 and DUF4098 domain-containing protein YvlB n=1 Tax=Rehaibacterium terrae TaxID=1341696 RepID=A0A7W8DCW5_9GAMM|nr:hypothetical protein [Rehaibacterium terrae]MBB5014808.1 DUF4097 and DUF4098 domain-containing protein YvlB [Rehaibacterium terrae]
MKRILLALALTVACGSVAAQENISRLNGAITAEAGKHYGKLDTVNGGIRIRAGAVVRSAETVNGGITVDDEAQAGALETVNGGIRLGERVQVAGNVATVNGGVRIDRNSRVDGEVRTVNGRIEMEATEVGGGLETVNGDVTVGTGSTVRGGLTVRKPSGSGFRWNLFGGQSRDPRIVIGPGASVLGELVFEREVELFVHETAKIGNVSGASPRRFSGDMP